VLSPVTDETFDVEVLGADVPVLVDFWSEWCPPCKAIESTLVRVAEDIGDRVKIVSLDCGVNFEAVSRYNVRSMPTFILFKNGEPADMRVGAAQSHVGFVKWLESHTA
jgi:thioredoxin 1